MIRFRLLASCGAVAMLLGCATTRQVTIDRDPIDHLIAKSAENATKALRELSESTGNSRVVLTSKQEVPPLLAPAPVAPAEKLPKPLTPSIGAKSGSIAIDNSTAPPAPAVASITSPSSGVVASGGLLSAPPAGLERLVTVRWTGELEDLLSRIAAECGWSIAQHSGLRVAPVVISISAENRSAFDVLRDIGAIAGSSAEIVVSATSRTLSVRYPQR
ncbi:hypothetical protein CBP36_19895 (plasmid) [Acidovorax carolinensis]|uniref:Uncharacterized protein n=2 Tax=Acidovorax carolinensis TaxID=553814 RepID=A0A240UIA8_9BURK|nr:hypothetical protein CBP36_19895 [Acidovorax carolinensis]